MLKIVFLVGLAAACCQARNIASQEKIRNKLNKTDDASEGMEYCSGWVDADGATIRDFPADCFRVEKKEVGVYQIYFKEELPNPPVCTVTQVYPGNFDWHGLTTDNAIIMSSNKEKVVYVTGDTHGNAQDRKSNFICVWE